MSLTCHGPRVATQSPRMASATDQSPAIFFRASTLPHGQRRKSMSASPSFNVPAGSNASHPVSVKTRPHSHAMGRDSGSEEGSCSGGIARLATYHDDSREPGNRE